MEQQYHFILLIRKNDFIDLFKFGYINAFCPSVPFNGNLEKAKNDKKLAEKLFKQASPFEYSIEYYLMHVINDKKTLKQITIDRVQHIFALDSNSIKIGLDLNPHVKLESPLWPEAYELFQTNIMQKNAEEGVKNVFEAFGIEPQIKRKNFITKKDISIITKLIYNGERPNGKLSVWVYLLMYERHQYYPKDIRGYFLDVLNVWANSDKEYEIDKSVSNSSLGKKISNIQNSNLFGNDDFEDLTEVMENDKNVSNIENKFKGFFRTAALFLILKDTFKDGLEADRLYFGKHINELKDTLSKYGMEYLMPALYLLGLTLGHEMTYKYVYKLRKYPVLAQEHISE